MPLDESISALMPIVPRKNRYILFYSLESLRYLENGIWAIYVQIEQVFLWLYVLI